MCGKIENFCSHLKTFACVSVRYRNIIGGLLVLVCGKICGCGKMCGKICGII